MLRERFRVPRRNDVRFLALALIVALACGVVLASKAAGDMKAEAQTALPGEAHPKHLERADAEKTSDQKRYALHTMAVAGEKKHLTTLISAGADINAADENGYTPLHYACIEGHLGCVQALLEKGARTDAKDENGYTPLARALELGQAATVKEFVRRGIGLGTVDPRGRTLLMGAIQCNMLEVVADLLGKNPDINAVDAQGETALHKAAYGRQSKFLSMLLEAGAAVNATSELTGTPLHRATLRQNERSVKILLEAGADANMSKGNGLTALHLAAINGCVPIAKILIDNGANIHAISESGNTVLAYALHSGDRDTVKLLLDRGALMFAGNARSWEQTFRTMSECEKEVRVLLPQLNSRALARMRDEAGTTMLHVAAKRGDLQMAERLLASGADLDAINDEGYTPLMCSFASRDRKTVKLLLTSGARIFGGDSHLCRMTFEGILAGGDSIRGLLTSEDLTTLAERWKETDTTPLHLAARKRAARIVEMLLAQGADINAISDSNETPVVCALRSGDEETARILFSRKPEVFAGNSQVWLRTVHALLKWQGDLGASRPQIDLSELADMRDESGSTVLHAAARAGQDDVVKLLLSVSTDVNARDKSGMTPLHWAMRQRRMSTAALLLKSGADTLAKNSAGVSPMEIAQSAGLSVNDLGTRLVGLGNYAAGMGNALAARMAYRASLKLEPQDSLPGIAAKYFIYTFGRGNEAGWKSCLAWMSEQKFSQEETARIRLAYAGLCLDRGKLDQATDLLTALTEEETGFQIQARFVRAFCFAARNDDAATLRDLEAVTRTPGCGKWGKLAEYCMGRDSGGVLRCRDLIATDMLRHRDFFAMLKDLETTEDYTH